MRRKTARRSKSPLVTSRVDRFGNGIGNVVNTFMDVKNTKLKRKK